jgi:hypothetical protein
MILGFGGGGFFDLGGGVPELSETNRKRDK